MRISDADLKALLLKSGKVKAADLESAESSRKQSKETLLVTVLKKKLIPEKDLIRLYADSLGIPFVELRNIKIPREVITKIPERTAKKYQVVIFGKKGGEWQLAMADPEEFQAIDFIEKQVGTNLKIFASTPADISSAIDQYKGSLDTEITQAIKDTGDEEAGSPEVSAQEISEDSPIAKTVNIILEYAIKSRASDVHIEPHESLVQIRYRIDGVLHETMTLPRPLLPAVVSRIKILSNLKIDEHRIPQDGRFKIASGANAVALRVSTLPVMDGEKVVMRLLDESSRALTLEELGFFGRALAIINRNLKKPHGMVLVTGPTGSGKSTTLYSILSLMNTPGVNISTVEDPVEYRISGVNQTQVNVKAGMTFANGLRALLRQDPNIIMVGEIRDSETADLAVQAALTGHVVLSTLHTNNAATSLPRLLDMKIEPFLIASTVNTVIGQRLCRRLCQICRVSYTPEGPELEEIREEFQVDAALDYLKQSGNPKLAVQAAVHDTAAANGKGSKKVIQPPSDVKVNPSILARIAADPNLVTRSASEAETVKQKAAQAVQTIDSKAIKKGRLVLHKAGPGCDQCGQTGYLGRIGIYEVLEVDEAIGKMITGHATSEEIQQQAIRDGMLTMQQDGFLKTLQGLTTIEEVLRVTRE